MAKYLLKVLMQNDRMLKLEVDTRMIKLDTFILYMKKLGLREVGVIPRAHWLASGRPRLEPGLDFPYSCVLSVSP